MDELIRHLLWLPGEASASAREVDRLHAAMFLATLVASAGLFSTVAFWLFRHRRRREDEPTRRIAAPLPLEVLAVAAPLALFLLLWALGLGRSAAGRGAPDGALEVAVGARQWAWSFSYPDGRGSDSVLVVPVNRPVRLTLTSRDVIHGFSIPAFRVQQDAVPGLVATASFESDRPGSYPIFCTELCGTGHSGMRGEVLALPPADFAAWLEGRLRPPARALDLVRMGERVMVEQGCARCHSSTGERGQGPTFYRLYGSMVKLERGPDVLADEGYITESMMDPTVKVVATFTPSMPSYQGKISAAETAAIIEYIKSLRGPATPESIVPGGSRP
jgi:cytochrome c oxidase subunit 2